MRKLIILMVLMFGTFLLVSCDVIDAYTVEKWEVYDYVEGGVILSDRKLFNATLKETNELTMEDCQIGDIVYIRVYDSGKIEVLENYEEPTTEIVTTEVITEIVTEPIITTEIISETTTIITTEEVMSTVIETTE